MSVRERAVKKVIASTLFAKLASLATGKKTSDVRRLFNNALKPSASRSIPVLQLVLSTLATRDKLAVVQVGANDGKTGDPIFSSIHRYGARALLIEPQPWLVSELRANYLGFDGEVIIENIAIGPEQGELGLYVLRRHLWDDYIAKVGRHPSAIFSPVRAQLLGRVAPRLGLDKRSAEAAIEKVTVPVDRLCNVMDRHGFNEAEVVQIDCEGWDFEVIKSLGETRPSVINFESFNLSDEIWHQFVLWSEKNGYGFIRGHQDTLAVRGFSQSVIL